MPNHQILTEKDFLQVTIKSNKDWPVSGKNWLKVYSWSKFTKQIDHSSFMVLYDKQI